MQCNEARPSCSYCEKRLLPCWYPKSQFEVAWRDQNQVASKAVKRRLNTRDKSSSPESELPNTQLHRRNTTEVPWVLPQDYENYALTFFFNSYLLPSTLSNHQRGFLGGVYAIWKKAGPSSPLRPAVNAVAQALLEAWSFMNPNSPQSLASSYYAQGVVAVRRQLQDGDDIDDDVLLATLLLDMYDGVISFCDARPHNSPHVRGSAAMIQNRRRLPVNSKTSQATLSGVRSRIVGDALKKREPVSTSVLTWTTSTQISPRTPEVTLEEINVRVANLQVSALDLEAGSAGTPVSASELLAKANELDERLAAWFIDLPEEWVPTIIWDLETIPPSVRNAGLYQDHCTIHKDMWTADTINIHSCSRIKIGLVMLQCLEHENDPVANVARIKAQNTLQALADTICASVPYHLGDRVGLRRIDDTSVQYPHVKGEATPDEHYVTAAAYGGMFLMKRLAELLQLAPYLRAGQVPWILGQMGRIKKVYSAKSH
ncbi:MAG: hypothetical protein Q9169_007361 [Polycauliona sp. 2 TL-2023]